MDAIAQIIDHTPIWVWLIFAYGLWTGIQALRPRTRSVRMLILLPLVMLGLSISSLVTVFGSVPSSAFFWGLALVLGFGLGFFVLKATVLEADPERGRLLVSGTWVTLVVFLAIFGVKYFYGVAVGMHPELSQDAGFVSLLLGLSGLGTGTLLGRVTKLLLDYSRGSRESQGNQKTA